MKYKCTSRILTLLSDRFKFKFPQALQLKKSLLPLKIDVLELYKKFVRSCSDMNVLSVTLHVVGHYNM